MLPYNHQLPWTSRSPQVNPKYRVFLSFLVQVQQASVIALYVEVVVRRKGYGSEPARDMLCQHAKQSAKVQD